MPNDPELIRKSYTTKQQSTNPKERTVTAVITTGSVDRDNEVILPDALQVDSFLENPVVMWAHDYRSPPIGRAEKVVKKSNRWVATTRFADTPFANELFQMVQDDMLRAWSIGFDPIKWHDPTPEEVAAKPALAKANRIYDEVELMEYSLVPIPKNPEALTQMAAKYAGPAAIDVQYRGGLLQPDDGAPKLDEHYCRLRNHSDYCKFVRTTKGSEAKQYHVIYGNKVEGDWEKCAIAFPAVAWNVEQVCSHCRSLGIHTFRMAIKSKNSMVLAVKEVLPQVVREIDIQGIVHQKVEKHVSRRFRRADTTGGS